MDTFDAILYLFTASTPHTFPFHNDFSHFFYLSILPSVCAVCSKAASKCKNWCVYAKMSKVPIRFKHAIHFAYDLWSFYIVQTERKKKREWWWWVARFVCTKHSMRSITGDKWWITKKWYVNCNWKRIICYPAASFFQFTFFGSLHSFWFMIFVMHFSTNSILESFKRKTRCQQRGMKNAYEKKYEKIVHLLEMHTTRWRKQKKKRCTSQNDYSLSNNYIGIHFFK